MIEADTHALWQFADRRAQAGALRFFYLLGQQLLHSGTEFAVRCEDGLCVGQRQPDESRYGTAYRRVLGIFMGSSAVVGMGDSHRDVVLGPDAEVT